MEKDAINWKFIIYEMAEKFDNVPKKSYLKQHRCIGIIVHTR